MDPTCSSLLGLRRDEPGLLHRCILRKGNFMKCACQLIIVLFVLLIDLLAATNAVSQSKANGKAPRSKADAGPPVSGKDSRGVRFLDQVMLFHMNKIDCSSATLAISYRGKLVHSRGYGWIDKEKKVPTEPGALIGIASCEKPITAAAIKQMAKKGKLNLDDKVFELLKIQPKGNVIDDRIHQISLRHLLEHKSGWQGEPIEKAAVSARESGAVDPIPVDVLLSHLMCQKLTSDPGTQFQYCNFCYDTLRYVVENTSKKAIVDYFRTELFNSKDVDATKHFASWAE